MIDFIRIKISNGFDKTLLSNTELDFYYQVNPRTSEIRSTNKRGKKVVPCQKANYKGMLFKVFDTGLVIIEGSLHKYWNNGKHNFNDFDIESIRIVLSEFLRTFNIDPKTAIITELEIGYNVSIPYPLSRVLPNFFFHRKTRFTKTDTKTEGNYYQVRHKQYRIKIYDKSLQYRSQHPYALNKELLRVEINWKGVQLRRLYNIKTLDDLMNFPFDTFTSTIKKEIEGCLFYDYTISDKSKRMLNYANQNYWQGLIEFKSKSTYEKHQNILKRVRLSNSQNILAQLTNAIELKSRELLAEGTLINYSCKHPISTPHTLEKHRRHKPDHLLPPIIQSKALT